jgi:hypothetical protein
MGATKYRSYTQKQREAVLASVREKGVCAAAEVHSIAPSCVSRWAQAGDRSRACQGADFTSTRAAETFSPA